MKDQRTLIAVLLLVVGALALAAGVVYLTVQAPSLPSFMGKLPNYHGHRTNRGTAGVIVGALLLLGGIGMLVYYGRSSTE